MPSNSRGYGGGSNFYGDGQIKGKLNPVTKTGELISYAIKREADRSTSPYWTRVRSATVEVVKLSKRLSELSTRAHSSIVSRPTIWRRLETTSLMVTCLS